MSAVALFAMGGLFLFGRRFNWLPSGAALRTISGRFSGRRHV